MKKRPGGLGRGLGALLGEVGRDGHYVPPTGPAGPNEDQIVHVPIHQVKPDPDQPRRHFAPDALAELADSIRAQGQIQPILVKPDPDGGYILIAGERRWRALQQLGKSQVAAIVRNLADEAAAEIALIDNIQREDLNPVEEALAYQKLMGRFGHTQDKLAQLVGKSRSHVANMVRLLLLPETVREQVMTGALSMGHARALVGHDAAEALAARIIRDGLSVRATERLVKKGGDTTTAKSPRARKAGAARDADVIAVEQHLGDLLGIKVEIVHRDDGQGEVVLHYSTLDQLDMLCQRLSGERF